MRVLFTASSMRIGGSENVLCRLLKHLDRSRFEPHLALLSTDGHFMSRIPDDVAVHGLHVKRARYATLPIASLARKLRPHAVFSLAAQLNSAAILARELMPSSVRVLVREGANITEPEVASRSYRWIYKALYKRADVVICQTKWMANALNQDFSLDPSKMAVIYNPVDPADLMQAAECEPNPFVGLGPHLVAVGRLMPIKGFDLLLDAMPDILRAHPTAHLTIVGDGPERQALSAQQKLLGIEENVSLTGYLTNPFPFIKHADLLVIPSRSEALSNVALEALALGTHVVATDCPGGNREIAETTDGMWIAPEVLPRSIAETVTSALQHKKRDRKNCALAFLDRFSVNHVISHYEAVLERAVYGRQEARARAARS